MRGVSVDILLVAPEAGNKVNDQNSQKRPQPRHRTELCNRIPPEADIGTASIYEYTL